MTENTTGNLFERTGGDSEQEGYDSFLYNSGTTEVEAIAAVLPPNRVTSVGLCIKRV